MTDQRNPENVKPTYSDEVIKILNDARIERLGESCQELRHRLGLKEIVKEQVLVSALRVYLYSLTKRIKSKMRRGLLQ